MRFAVAALHERDVPSEAICIQALRNFADIEDFLSGAPPRAAADLRHRGGALHGRQRVQPGGGGRGPGCRRHVHGSSGRGSTPAIGTSPGTTASESDSPRAAAWSALPPIGCRSRRGGGVAGGSCGRPPRSQYRALAPPAWCVSGPRRVRADSGQGPPLDQVSPRLRDSPVGAQPLAASPTAPLVSFAASNVCLAVRPSSDCS
jgi:hypothetical protein